jgi:hypothetical protein
MAAGSCFLLPAGSSLRFAGGAARRGMVQAAPARSGAGAWSRGRVEQGPKGGCRGRSRAQHEGVGRADPARCGRVNHEGSASRGRPDAHPPRSAGGQAACGAAGQAAWGQLASLPGRAADGARRGVSAVIPAPGLLRNGCARGAERVAEGLAAGPPFWVAGAAAPWQSGPPAGRVAEARGAGPRSGWRSRPQACSTWAWRRERCGRVEARTPPREDAPPLAPAFAGRAARRPVPAAPAGGGWRRQCHPQSRLGRTWRGPQEEVRGTVAGPARACGRGARQARWARARRRAKRRGARQSRNPRRLQIIQPSCRPAARPSRVWLGPPPARSTTPRPREPASPGKGALPARWASRCIRRAACWAAWLAAPAARRAAARRAAARAAPPLPRRRRHAAPAPPPSSPPPLRAARACRLRARRWFPPTT